MFGDRHEVDADVVDGHGALERPRKNIHLFLNEILDHVPPPELRVCVGKPPPLTRAFLSPVPKPPGSARLLRLSYALVRTVPSAVTGR